MNPSDPKADPSGVPFPATDRFAPPRAIRRRSGDRQEPSSADVAAWVATLGAQFATDAPGGAAELLAEAEERAAIQAEGAWTAELQRASGREALEQREERHASRPPYPVGDAPPELSSTNIDETAAEAPAPRTHSPSRHARTRKRIERRQRKIAATIRQMRARARAAGDCEWEPEAFPWLDFRLRSEVRALQLDTTGKKARMVALDLPVGQTEALLEEAQKIAALREGELEDAFRTVRWRELVAAAMVSWRLSRPFRAKSKAKGPSAPKEVAEVIPPGLVGRVSIPGTGDTELGRTPPDPEGWVDPPTKESPWKGGRIVDGYARGAYALLFLDVRTGERMSFSKLFYRNGSGELGPIAYCGKAGLGLYQRKQPYPTFSKYVGPVKVGPDGKPLLDKKGRPQRYALGEHWYTRAMCGRSTGWEAQRGRQDALELVQVLAPWLLPKSAEEPSEEALDAAQEARERSTAGALPSEAAEPLAGAPEGGDGVEGARGPPPD